MRVSLLALAGLTTASAVGPRFKAAGPDAVANAPRALITEAPVVGDRPFVRVPQHLNKRVAQRRAAASIPSCARSCIESAITEDTTCTVGEYSCACQYSNGLAIETAAEVCVESACGYVLAYSAWVTMEDLCLTYAYTYATYGPNTAVYTAGAYTYTDAYGITHTYAYTATDSPTDETTTSASATRTKGSESTATNGNDGGSTTTVTSGSSGSSGDASGSSSTTSSKGLSKGAIAGIAVGAAGGAIILCAILFLVYRCTKHNDAASVATAARPNMAESGAGAGAGAVGGGAAQGGVNGGLAVPNAPSPMPGGSHGSAAGNAANVSTMSAAAVPVAGVGAAALAGHELDGKSSAVTSTIATTPTSPLAQSVSPVSAQTGGTGQTGPTAELYSNAPDAAAIAAWQQQQYAQQYGQQLQYGQQYGQQQHDQQPYVVQGYSIAPGQAPQAQTVLSPAGYAAAHPSQPVPGVLYQEAPDGIPQTQIAHELSSGGQYSNVASPLPPHVVPVAVGPQAALPVSGVPVPQQPQSAVASLHRAPVEADDAQRRA